jgi:hypothetical protein
MFHVKQSCKVLQGDGFAPLWECTSACLADRYVLRILAGIHEGGPKGLVYLPDDRELVMARVSRETFFSHAAFSGWQSCRDFSKNPEIQNTRVPGELGYQKIRRDSQLLTDCPKVSDSRSETRSSRVDLIWEGVCLYG